jgi:hypothetical protein
MMQTDCCGTFITAVSGSTRHGASLHEGGPPEQFVQFAMSSFHWMCSLVTGPLQVAAPMVVGMLAFGGRWDGLLRPDPEGVYPIKVAEDHSSTTKKVRGRGSTAGTCRYLQLSCTAGC